MKTVKLRGGVEAPLLGIGTFQIWNQHEAQTAVLNALTVGFRAIDTAAGYFNEEAVGAAIKASSVPRSQLTITSKVWPTDSTYAGTKRAVERSLKKLQLDYIDIMLLHQAYGDYYGAWRALRKLQQAGVIRTIGVSNFGAARLFDLAHFSGVTPAIDQIQLNPYRQQQVTRHEAANLGTIITGWGPFAEGKSDLFSNPQLMKIAENHDATVAQIILAWQLQQGIMTIPKSVHLERLKENFAAQNIQLTTGEMTIVGQLDRHPDEVGPNESPDLLHRILTIDSDKRN